MPNQRPFFFDLRRLRPKGRGRSAILKGIALFLLFVFVLQLSRQYWTFTLLVAGVAMGWWGLSTYRRKRQQQEEILSEIRGMGEEEFIQYVADLLQSQGYRVQPTGRVAGPKFLLRRGEEQVACWLKQQRVTKDVIAEIIKDPASQGSFRAMVITAVSFTRGATAVARRQHCILLDRERLVALILQHRQGHRVLPFRREREERERSSAGAD
jgi:hypothetical protein